MTQLASDRTELRPEWLDSAEYPFSGRRFGTADGVMHYVDEGTDTGPILLQREVPILQGDTEETLSTRILSEEHRAYPEAIARVLSELEKGA